jgi:beta-lactam-binding protein with PASTA domain
MLKSLAKHLSGIALTWVVVLAGTLFLLRWYSQPSAQREVPPLAGMAQTEAADALGALGLEAVWQDSIYAPSGTPGAVVEQHPPAGSSVKVGRKVLLTTYRVTPPSERVAIEEGQDAKLAERILTTRGFRVEVKEEPNKLLAGKVIRVEHQGGAVSEEALYPKGTRLRLVVGVAGAKDVRVPWLVGLTLKDAAGILARRNLALGHVGYADDITNALDTSLAVVVSQDASPADLLYVREGTAIDLYLGKH